MLDRIIYFIPNKKYMNLSLKANNQTKYVINYIYQKFKILLGYLLITDIFLQGVSIQKEQREIYSADSFISVKINGPGNISFYNPGRSAVYIRFHIKLKSMELCKQLQYLIIILVQVIII